MKNIFIYYCTFDYIVTSTFVCFQNFPDENSLASSSFCTNHFRKVPNIEGRIPIGGNKDKIPILVFERKSE